jgi:hypothetical protein
MAEPSSWRFRWLYLTLCLPLLAFTPGLASQIPERDRNPGPVSVAVTVDSQGVPLSTFLGLGVEFDPYEFPPPVDRWRTILDRVAFARFGFFRVMSGASDYCLGFDKAGEPIYVWNHPGSRAQERFDRLLSVLDFAQAHDISVYLGEWSPPRELGITSPDDPRWPRLIADFVHYLVTERHYSVVGHYIFFNEPNGGWMWPHSSPDFTAWSNGVKRLRQEFDARGLNSVLISGPDNSGNPDWFARSVRELGPQFGAWETHIYATDPEVYDDTIEAELSRARTLLIADSSNQGKERFVAESGLQDGKIESLDQQPRVRTFPYGVMMADYVAQVARAGWMGADAWDLDDAMHSSREGSLKVWGFWNSSAPEEMSVRPWFYTWSLMSRYFPRGASILRVNVLPAASRFRATAASWNSQTGDKCASLLLVNDSDDAIRANVHDLPVGAERLYLYHYFESDRPATSEGLPAPAKAFVNDPAAGLTVDLPSRGVILITNARP